MGLLHPIVINEQNRLVAGARRLKAAKELGWHDVPVRVVRTLAQATKAPIAERDENTCRKDFLPSEAVALARDLEPFERKAAKARQGTRTDKHPGKLPESSKGERREKIAKAVGVARRTLDKAEAIVKAAEREPEKFAKLREQMDRTGNVHGAYKQQLQKRKQAETINAEPPPLPTGPFRVIVADPPWQYDTRASDVTHRSNLRGGTGSRCCIPTWGRGGGELRFLAAPQQVGWCRGGSPSLQITRHEAHVRVLRAFWACQRTAASDCRPRRREGPSL